jgi:dephospho-CoA kinase
MRVRCSFVFAGKPIIGVIGGIGSGKSFVARLFGELGCLVIDSDRAVREAYASPEVRQALRQWWGDQVLDATGAVDRSAVARIVFADPPQLQRLEHLLHPMVARRRDQIMAAAANDAQVVAFIWDTPLLLETQLDRSCDAVVFVDAPLAARAQRVAATRGWDEAELLRREKAQLPLDRKREIADHVIDNAADADTVRRQVRQVLSRILSGERRSGPHPGPGGSRHP